MEKSNKKIQNKNLKAAKGAAAERKLSPTNLALIIVSAVLALSLLVGLIFIIFSAVEKHEDDNFDYITSDLSKYITMDRANYKDYSLSLDIAKPHDIDVDVTILNLLASKKGDVLHQGTMQTSGKITPGDVVSIYYRGYLKDENGNEQYVANMCNFGSKDSSGAYVAASLEIGSNSFVPGFELGLSGLDFTSANKFVRITEVTINDSHIIYISYTKQLDGSTSSSDKTTASAERIVLADGKEQIDEKYGDGFYDKIISQSVGATEGISYSTTISGKTYNYTGLKIDFATECEKEGSYFLVECYFPYDYGMANLNNKTAYFEVYVQGVIEYTSPEFNDAFIEENLGKDDFGVTEEDLEEYNGTLTEKVRAFIKDLLDEEYEASYKTALEEAMWEHYRNENVSVVSKYPTKKVDAIYLEYYKDVEYQFEQSGGSITNALGTSVTCETVDEYAVIYLGLEYAENQDWRSVLRTMAEDLVRERLILYYIMKEENLMPTDAELAEQVAASKAEYLEEYISQYLAEYEKSKDDYTEEEWAKFEEDRAKELYDYYNDEYFTEIAYYEIALKSFLTWPTVTTLDDLTVATQ